MMKPPPTRAPDDPRSSRVILRRELLAEGYDDRAIARLVSRGVLARVRHGAYCDATVWRGLDDAGRHAVRSRAVLRQAKAPLVLSHVSGLLEYGVPTWGLDLSTVHVTRLDRRAGRNEAGVHQHCGVVTADDLVEVNDIAVMAATRLAFETTTIADAEVSLAVVNHLLHAGFTTTEALDQAASKYRHWPHSLATNLVLRLCDRRIESVGESRSFMLCFRQGLPMPVPQFEVFDSSGRLVGRVDFAWPELGVFLEFDGKAKYEKYLKQGERPSDVVIREKRREERICRITGWRCIRLTWADLEHPARTAAHVRSVLFPTSRAA